MQLNSYKFFCNRDCAYYPCHNTDAKDNFNCLFCYCPLYPFKDCGGEYQILKSGVKDCSQCLIPHYDYDYIIEMIKKTNNNMKLKEGYSNGKSE